MNILVKYNNQEPFKVTTTLSGVEFTLIMKDVLFWVNDTFSVNSPNKE